MSYSGAFQFRCPSREFSGRKEGELPLEVKKENDEEAVEGCSGVYGR